MKQETKKRRAREGLFNTYVTKNDTLSNRQNAKHVRESLELVNGEEKCDVALPW